MNESKHSAPGQTGLLSIAVDIPMGQAPQAQPRWPLWILGLTLLLLLGLTYGYLFAPAALNLTN